MHLMKAIFIFILPILCAACATSACAGDSTQYDLNLASIDTVWQTVNEYHFDSTFGGLDWPAIHDRYRKLVAEAKDDTTAIRLMNDMLLELKLSHYAVFRMDKMVKSGSPIVAEASVGLEIRLFGRDVVVAFVQNGFPAAGAGIKPGYAITSIDGTPVLELLDRAAARHIAHFSERRKISRMVDEIERHFFGRVGDTVHVSYVDGDRNSHDVTLGLKKRGEGAKIAEQFPTVYVDFHSQRLTDEIGYIYFSAFLPPADSLFLDALNRMHGIKALIIDIRGNPGGMHDIGEAIASKFVTEETVFSVFRYRDSTSQVVLEPHPPIFTGPVAILIDVRNASASERFSACMQSIGRATIIGERSSGSVGPSDVKKLPNGASFMYLEAQSLTPDGTVLEGRGVIPDIVVPLDRAALLKGVDTQIEHAKAYLNSQSD